MKRHELYSIWAPERSPWSAWAKPVLFTQVPLFGKAEPPTIAEQATPSFDWAEPHQGRAIIVDLPGPISIAAGVLLAQQGFRPVPLFNTTHDKLGIINIMPTVDAMRERTPQLASIQVPHDAPPAFLIDSGRSPGTIKALPGQYDNRWVVFPQDFPSSRFFRNKGIGEIVVVQDHLGDFQEDLRHVLLRFQEGGLRITAATAGGRLRPGVTVSAPSGFGLIFQRLLVLFGLRRNSAGGFGGWVPSNEGSSGGRMG